MQATAKRVSERFDWPDISLLSEFGFFKNLKKPFPQIELKDSRPSQSRLNAAYRLWIRLTAFDCGFDLRRRWGDSVYGL